jgi:hypothetical protein
LYIGRYIEMTLKIAKKHKAQNDFIFEVGGHFLRRDK